MNRRIIEMTPANMVPEHLREYAYHIFEQLDCTSSSNSKQNYQFQCFCWLICKAESILKKADIHSDYFKGTMAVHEYADVLKRYRQGDEDAIYGRKSNFPYGGRPEFESIYVFGNYGEKAIFPYFAMYFCDNKLQNTLEALKSIFKTEQMKFEFELLSQMEYRDIFSLKSICEYGYSHNHDTIVHKDELLLLANSCLLGDFKDRYTLRPVFVTEYDSSANQLESDIMSNYFHYLEEEVSEYNNSNNDPGHTYKISIETNIQSGQYAPKRRPLGDAIWVAPSFGYHYPALSDWSNLANRKVYIFKFGEKNDSVCYNELMKVFSAIFNQISEIDNAGKDCVRHLNFVIFPAKVSPQINENNIRILSSEEFVVECYKNKIEIPEELKSYYDKILRKRKGRHTSDFIVEPVLRRKDWMLITGEEGSGKTWLAMGMAAAIATNGRLFNGWTVRRRRCKVLYVTDDEMTESIFKERQAIFKGMYSSKLYDDMFLSIRVHDLNLLEEEQQEKMEKTIVQYADEGRENIPVEVIVFDHLLKLTDTQGDDFGKWTPFRKWLEQLAGEKNLSIILVHHEYGGSRMLGTRQIANDVGTRIHVEDWYRHIQQTSKVQAKSGTSNVFLHNDGCIDIGYRIIKNRGGKTDREIHHLLLDLKAHQWIGDGEEHADNTGTCNWKNMSKEEREAKIIELHQKGTITEDIAKLMGVKSKSTIEKYKTRLFTEGKIKARREGGNFRHK